MIELSTREGEALRALDAMLRGATPTRQPPILAPSAELLRLGSERMRRAAVEWLVDGGGWRERSLLRDGARVRGRAWSAELARGLTLRFTRASLDLWLVAGGALEALAAEGDATQRREARESLRSIAASAQSASGDWVIAARFAALDRRLGARSDALWWETLGRCSPLVALMFPGRGEPAALRPWLRDTLRAPERRVLECAAERLADAWIHAARRAIDEPLIDRAARRWSALAEVMGAWCEALDEAERLDLTHPAARALREIVTALQRDAPTRARAALLGRVSIRSIASRDALLSAVRAALDVGARLERRRAEMALARYGDDRYTESQVFLAEVDGTLGPARVALRGLIQALSPQIE